MSSDICMKATSQEINQQSVTEFSLNITLNVG